MYALPVGEVRGLGLFWLDVGGNGAGLEAHPDAFEAHPNERIRTSGIHSAPPLTCVSLDEHHERRYLPTTARSPRPEATRLFEAQLGDHVNPPTPLPVRPGLVDRHVSLLTGT
ncbi:hypothetical protein AB0H83_18665 [Dactylosporangium sp. NPDC050688]|uniref:hypothetical protein n=1 Tax=Dactylosporangium sp. NPDC050688 TaxID=3157217 RepID=UPI0033FD1CAA